MPGVMILIDDTQTISQQNNEFFNICSIYAVLLKSVLDYNGIPVCILPISYLNNSFSIDGTKQGSVIYCPKLPQKPMNYSSYSSIYVDSTRTSSVSFRIADRIRSERSKIYNGAVFVNQLLEEDLIRFNRPIIVDNIVFSDNLIEYTDFKNNIYTHSLYAAKSFCEYYIECFNIPN